MFLDPTEKILDLDGKEIIIEEKPLLLSEIIVNCLAGHLEGDEKLSGSKKCDLIDLAEKFHKIMLPVEIKGEEADEILKRLERHPGYSKLVYSRVDRIVNSAKVASLIPKINGALECGPQKTVN